MTRVFVVNAGSSSLKYEVVDAEAGTSVTSGLVERVTDYAAAMADVLAELRQGYARIEVAYSELSDGAQIRYTTSDPAMVAALHAWFAAQLSDHGGHAVDHGNP